MSARAVDTEHHWPRTRGWGHPHHVPDLILKAGQVHLVTTDHLGSIRAVINSTTGTTVQSLEHDAWGTVLADTAPGFQPFGFAGGLYDPDTKLVHFGAREYDPQTGRWLTKDPAGVEGGTNLYEYAASDPINLIDLDGTTPFLAAVLFNAASEAGFEIASQLATNGGRFECLAWGSIGAAAALGVVLGPGAKGVRAARGLRRGTHTVGEFSVAHWHGYPAGVPTPSGPFRLLEGAEYAAARQSANQANAALRRLDPAKYAGKQIHEIHPVKFGGSPTDPANKIALTPKEHASYTTYWNRLMKDLK